MGVLQAMKNGFAMIGKNLKLWALMVGVSIILMVIAIPVMIAIFGPAAFQGQAANPPSGGQILMLLGVALIAVVIQIFINSGVVGCIRDIVKTQSLKLGSFLEYSKKYFVRYLLFSVTILLVILLVGIIMALIAMAVAAIAKGIAMVGVILGVIVAVAVVIILVLLGLYGSLVPVIIVAEDKGVMESIGCAAGLLKKKLWGTLGLALLFWAIFVVFAIINYIANLGIPAVALVTQIVISLINTYLSLVYIGSFMAYYIASRSSGSVKI